MTLEQLAAYVADDFKKTMKEEGFETFAEVCRCYQWTSGDIKDEVDAIIRTAGGQYYIDELDGSTVFCGNDEIEYKTFSRMFRAKLKQ